MGKTTSQQGIVGRVADTAGVFGAILAALCCAGTPVIIGVVTALGLSFLRKDAILWPLMLLSLTVALWGFWRGYQCHRRVGPFLSGSIGAASLAAGVIVVHGFPAMEMIYGGAIVLVIATLWNILLRRRVARSGLR